MLKTIAIGLGLHGVFTIGIPWLILHQTAGAGWSALPLGPLRWIGVGLIAFGIYLYLWSLIRLIQRQTSALPGQAPTHLQTSGWYGRVRHPLLLGVVAILLGEAVAFAALPLLAYALLYWLWLHLFVSRRSMRLPKRADQTIQRLYALAILASGARDSVESRLGAPLRDEFAQRSRRTRARRAAGFSSCRKAW